MTTVKELIAALQRVNPDLPVVITPNVNGMALPKWHLDATRIVFEQGPAEEGDETVCMIEAHPRTK
jgi:hypothetical protein